MTTAKDELRKALIPVALMVLASDALSAIGLFMTGRTPTTAITVSAVLTLLALALMFPRQQPVESPPQEKVP